VIHTFADVRLFLAGIGPAAAPQVGRTRTTMPPHLRSRTEPKQRIRLPLRLGRVCLLALPVALLALAGLRAPDEAAGMLLLGAACLGLGGLLTLWLRQGGRERLGPVLIMIYVGALVWLVAAGDGARDWFSYVAQAVLLVVPVGLFGVQCLHDSGAITMRRARLVAAKLRCRRGWPSDLTMCRLLPEVQELRDSLHVDASPALELLTDLRPAVRVAALAALEHRMSWRTGQPQVILQLAQRAPEPEVRAAAVAALANTDDRVLIESLCDRMRDQSSLVRLAAAEAAFHNSEQRWTWVRPHVHQALADPDLQDDGPLHLGGQPLPQEVVEDFHTWCGEKGGVGLRAALTLGQYYTQRLAASPGPELIGRLRKELLAAHTAPMLRLELARLMYQKRELDGESMRVLLAPTMPAPVRLIAAEALLSQGSSLEAVAALHDLARLPNREIALSTAEVVQKRLGIDLGLPRGPLPAVQSRAAAEVARRVLLWANQHDVNDPTPRPRHTSSRVNLA
jgi:hypothetical protein